MYTRSTGDLIETVTPHYDRRPVGAVAPGWWRAAGNSGPQKGDARQPAAFGLDRGRRDSRNEVSAAIPSPAGRRRAVRMSAPDLTIERERLIAATGFRLTASLIGWP